MNFFEIQIFLRFLGFSGIDRNLEKKRVLWE